MKTSKSEVAETEVTNVDTEVAENETTTKSDKNSATVEWLGQSRTYTREMHGDNFMALAKEFAAKKNGTLV